MNQRRRRNADDLQAWRCSRSLSCCSSAGRAGAGPRGGDAAGRRLRLGAPPFSCPASSPKSPTCRRSASRCTTGRSRVPRPSAASSAQTSSSSGRPAPMATSSFGTSSRSDGKPVRDRQQRLTSASWMARPRPSGIQRIIDESARYNIGTIERNVNTPTLPLLFLEPANQRRFRFKHMSDHAPAITRTPRERRQTSRSRPRYGWSSPRKMQRKR